MKLPDSVLTRRDCPELQAFDAFAAREGSINENHRAIHEFVEAARKKHTDAFSAFVTDSSLATFKAAVATHAEFARIEAAYKALVSGFGSHRRILLEAEDCVTTLESALAVVAARVQKLIANLNDQHTNSMKSAGLVPSGEHAAVPPLAEYLNRVQHAVGQCKRWRDSGDDETVPCPWTNYRQLLNPVQA